MRPGNRKFARVVFLNTGRGLLLDAKLIQKALEQGGWHVKLAPRRQRKQFEKKLIVWWEAFKTTLPPRYCRLLDRLQMTFCGAWRCHVELQIHLEDISLGYLGNASVNWLIPNQEWVYPHNLRHFPKLNRVLCKTYEACAIFEPHHCAVQFLGFSNPQMIQNPIPFHQSPERLHRFLHVAGKSMRKGTKSVVEAWRSHPEWPRLDIVIDDADCWGSLPANVRLWKNISDSNLEELRRDCGVVLAPSEVEGFGHVLIEAMMHGAVLVSTDAPPMNELVTSERGFLVNYTSTGAFKLGRLFMVTPESIEAMVERLLATPEEVLQRKAERAYAWVRENHIDFMRRFDMLCQEVVGQNAGDSGSISTSITVGEETPRN